jgi:hypothetical protein
MKLTDITEVETKTKTKPQVDLKFADPTSKGELTKPSAEKTKEVPQPKKATAADTSKALKGMTPTDAMRDMMGKLNIPDDAIAAEPDVEMPTTVAADNVPAIISTSLKKMGSEVGDQTAINPEFHQVKNLPGYLSKPIRVMGRETFKPYTKTPIEDISVIADLMGQGPNTPRDVQGVAKWLATNAQEVDRATMDYGSSMPGYEANTISYSTAGIRFMVVKDFAGYYIYAWPESDSVKQVGHTDTKQIA